MKRQDKRWCMKEGMQVFVNLDFVQLELFGELLNVQLSEVTKY
jgi:hypothetical protein